MIRYYWTFVVAFLLLVFIGVPAIAIGHVLRKFFGVEDFIFPPAKFGLRVYAWAAGTRSVDGRVKDFKKGVFYMAIEAGVPIVPVVVNDTRLVMRKGEKRVVPGDVYLEVLSPVSSEGYTVDSVGELIERVRDLIAER